MVAERVTLLPVVDDDDAVVVCVDGWPLLFVRRSTGEVAVNDLQASRSFARRAGAASLVGAEGEVTLSGTSARRALVLVSGRPLATMVLDPNLPTHADVVVCDPASGSPFGGECALPPGRRRWHSRARPVLGLTSCPAIDAHARHSSAPSMRSLRRGLRRSTQGGAW